MGGRGAGFPPRRIVQLRKHRYKMLKKKKKKSLTGERGTGVLS